MPRLEAVNHTTQDIKAMRILSIVIGALLFLSIAIQVGYRIGEEQIKVWDESSSARNAVIMLADQSYLMVETAEGRVPDHKPPFQLWLKVLSFKIFGVNEFAVRFPTLISALLTAALLWFFCAVWLRKIWLGNIVLLLISTTWGYMGYHVARHGDPDTLLTFEVLVYSIFYFLFLEKYPEGRWKYLIFTGLALVIAILTKSIAGLAPVAGLAVYTITQRKGWLALKDYRFYLVGLGSLALALSYFFIRELFDTGYLKDVYEQNFSVLTKYPGTPKHPEFSFYINYLWTIAFKPYFYFVPLIIVPLVFGNNNQIKRVILFAFLCAGIFLLGQSSALMKNEWYIAPIYPFLWLLAGAGIYGTAEFIIQFAGSHQLRIGIAAIFGIALIAIAAPKYQKIFKKNLSKSYANNPIYEPEREGNFFRSLKAAKPEVKSFKIISNQAQRSTDFYVQKYKYVDGTKATIYLQNKLPSIAIGDTIMACSPKIKEQIETTFNYEIVYNDRYCNLYYISDSISSIPIPAIDSE